MDGFDWWRVAELCLGLFASCAALWLTRSRAYWKGSALISDELLRIEQCKSLSSQAQEGDLLDENEVLRAELNMLRSTWRPPDSMDGGISTSAEIRSWPPTKESSSG